ncbi:MAG: hypothetical protein M3347_01620 [Armatimonadota bacterium]|nr:hypothetical protein [Armatimonadota bacterium]
MTTQTKPTTATTSSRRTAAPRVVTKRQPRLSARNRALLRLLDSWENATPEEIEEQRETHEFLQQALAADRLSLRHPLTESAAEEPPKSGR